VAPVKRGLQRGLKGRERTVVLFSDATIVRQTPPLRACWSRIGEPAEVPITGNRAKRVVYGTLNIGSGALCLDHTSENWNQSTFQAHLRRVRSQWRGWRIVLFLDRGSPHRAKATRALAKRLGIEFRFLPTACPELNPVEGLWRHVKNQILANEPTPDVETVVQRACDALTAMTQSQRRKTAGTLEDFWLAT